MLGEGTNRKLKRPQKRAQIATVGKMQLNRHEELVMIFISHSG